MPLQSRGGHDQSGVGEGADCEDEGVVPQGRPASLAGFEGDFQYEP